MEKITQCILKVPEGIQINLSGKKVEVSGPKGKLSRHFDVPSLQIEKVDGSIKISTSSTHRKDLSMINTVKGHLLNMFKGVSEGFVYKLKIVYSHFPITVKVEGDKVFIHNLLGERSPRVAKIVGETKVTVHGDEISVEGTDKEAVGQTALNLEQSTSIKYRDRRVFQDGIYPVRS